jgi:hypothetical protein
MSRVCKKTKLVLDEQKCILGEPARKSLPSTSSMPKIAAGIRLNTHALIFFLELLV